MLVVTVVVVVPDDEVVPLPKITPSIWLAFSYSPLPVVLSVIFRPS